VAELGGRVVAFLEARRAPEMADLIRRHNGVPLSVPMLREVHTPDAPELRAGVQQVSQSDVALALFLTGVGTRTVFDAARHAGLDTALRERLAAATVAVRGPKPAAALRTESVRIDITAPPPHTTAELLDAIAQFDLQGKTVAVQLYGAPNAELSDALRARGANLIELAPYVWDRPVDPAPVVQLLGALEQRRVDALLITSQAQVENLFSIAAERGLSPDFDGVAIGAQGPVAQAALERHGARAAFAPEHGHMGALVLAAARHFSAPKE
jgi:uroporphyrinogen-III synthase